MAKLDELKEKALNIFGSVADKTKDAASKTADTTKNFARIAKLTVDINGEKEVAKKAYFEIGKLYYEAHKDDAEEFLSQLVQEVTISLQTIAEMEEEIEELKASVHDKGDDGIEVVFEEVVAEYEDAAAETEVPTVDDDDIDSGNTFNPDDGD